MGSIEERFWSKADKSGDCWLWTAYRDKDGYGSFSVTHTKPVPAHRFAWIAVNGEIAEGLYVCHHCDNPSCVNPSHLFLGTPADNMLDRDRKGRHGCGFGENHGNSKLKELDIAAIRSSTLTQRELATLYGVDQSTISDVVNRKSWSHL